MRILVAVASRHGSTHDLAEAMSKTLQALDHDVTLADAGEFTAFAGYDAAIIGSAVYMGNWMGEARSFVETNAAELRRMPVWLFSSGPLGAEELKPTGDPMIVAEMMEKSGARGHRVFAGKLDKAALGIGERLITRMVGAPEGDFRPWDDVRDWATSIHEELQQGYVPPSAE